MNENKEPDPGKAAEKNSRPDGEVESYHDLIKEIAGGFEFTPPPKIAEKAPAKPAGASDPAKPLSQAELKRSLWMTKHEPVSNGGDFIKAAAEDLRLTGSKGTDRTIPREIPGIADGISGTKSKKKRKGKSTPFQQVPTATPPAPEVVKQVPIVQATSPEALKVDRVPEAKPEDKTAVTQLPASVELKATVEPAPSHEVSRTEPAADNKPPDTSEVAPIAEDARPEQKPSRPADEAEAKKQPAEIPGLDSEPVAMLPELTVDPLPPVAETPTPPRMLPVAQPPQQLPVAVDVKLLTSGEQTPEAEVLVVEEDQPAVESSASSADSSSTFAEEDAAIFLEDHIASKSKETSLEEKEEEEPDDEEDEPKPHFTTFGGACAMFMVFIVGDFFLKPDSQQWGLVFIKLAPFLAGITLSLVALFRSKHRYIKVLSGLLILAFIVHLLYRKPIHFVLHGFGAW